MNAIHLPRADSFRDWLVTADKLMPEIPLETWRIQFLPTSPAIVIADYGPGNRGTATRA
jgi:hypothetical protein